jgi:hypothetical protein
MAREYGGDLYDFQNMTDDEVRQVVIQHLGEYPNLDLEDIDVDVRDGRVLLSGRVGTDSEVEVAESILGDVLGLDSYSNELIVDELRRGTMPLGADDAVVYEEEHPDQIGSSASQQSDTADHLVEDLESETHGTHDMGKAIQDGNAYSPPDRPIGDGYRNREDH